MWLSSLLHPNGIPLGTLHFNAGSLSQFTYRVMTFFGKKHFFAFAPRESVLAAAMSCINLFEYILDKRCRSVYTRASTSARESHYDEYRVPISKTV